MTAPSKLLIILAFILSISVPSIRAASFGKSFISTMISSTHKSSSSDEERPVPDWPTTGNPHILLTGGAGYIGSHTVVCLIEAGFDVTVVDNLINSNEESLHRVRRITGCDEKRIRVYISDLCDTESFEKVFQTSPKFDACIHFAGLKAVGESVQKPLLYYENNLGSTINLLKMMDKYGCRSVVFSSSATVYGSAQVPITEDTPAGQGITNAYGRTKYMIEEILKDYKRATDLDVANAANPWSVVILRYFNPVGAHPSGLIGEDPNGIPNNLMPYVSQVVVGRRSKLTIFGNDYGTPDGTGVRDYIHVMDLAEGHVAALKYVQRTKIEEGKSGEGYGQYSVFNLGTGNGYSVLEMVEAMKKASGRPLPYEIGPRREGDIAVCYANPTKAQQQLHWAAKRGLQDMCTDLWCWQSKNPNGYTSASSQSSSTPEEAVIKQHATVANPATAAPVSSSVDSTSV